MSAALHAIPVCPSLCMSTSFVVKKIPDEYTYSRSRDPVSTDFRSELAKRYDAPDCILFPSGMAAIAAVLMTHARRGSVVFSDELYGDTASLPAYLNQLVGFKCTRADFNDLAALEASVTEQTSLVFYETCSNPTGKVPDYDAVAEIVLRKSPRATIAVDNSWLSPVLFRPRFIGDEAAGGVVTDSSVKASDEDRPAPGQCHLVIDSLSKYIGGGRIVAGAVLGTPKDNPFEIVLAFKHEMGQHVSSYDIWSAHDALYTLRLRVVEASTKTMQIVRRIRDERLGKDGITLAVHYPSDEIIAARFRDGLGPAVFAMEIDCDRSVFFAHCTSTPRVGENLLFATSYGKHVSLVDPWPKSKKTTDTTNGQAGKKSLQIRIAIGFDGDVDAETISKEIDDLLETLIRFKPGREVIAV